MSACVDLCLLRPSILDQVSRVLYIAVFHLAGESEVEQPFSSPSKLCRHLINPLTGWKGRKNITYKYCIVALLDDAFLEKTTNLLTVFESDCKKHISSTKQATSLRHNFEQKELVVKNTFSAFMQLSGIFNYEWFTSFKYFTWSPQYSKHLISHLTTSK